MNWHITAMKGRDQRRTFAVEAHDAIKAAYIAERQLSTGWRVADLSREPDMLAPKLTIEEIEAARSPKGGWTRKTLEGWGVPWPPPKGWKEALT